MLWVSLRRHQCVLIQREGSEVAVIVCESCGERIKRDIKTVKSLVGNVHDYHRECWRKREQTRRKEAHRLSNYRAMKVDREDVAEVLQPKRTEVLAVKRKPSKRLAQKWNQVKA